MLPLSIAWWVKQEQNALLECGKPVAVPLTLSEVDLRFCFLHRDLGGDSNKASELDAGFPEVLLKA